MCFSKAHFSIRDLGFHFLGRTILESSYEQKVFNYITALENTNEELLNTLKKCVEILTQFKPMVPDPYGFQEMLNLFHETIKLGERTIEEKIYH